MELKDLKELINKLRGIGAAKVVAEYDGSGDSGEVNEVSARDAAGKEVKLDEDIRKAIDDAACAFLDEYGIDWYNNEGGCGKYILDTMAATQRLEHSERVTTTEDSCYDSDPIDMDDEKDVAEEMAVCTCPDLLKGHHPGCPYIRK
jgi:hypothetical protein